jgi:diguanylate cyclase (GGDEF)-like protein/PAS domain S-box-containing protein
MAKAKLIDPTARRSRSGSRGSTPRRRPGPVVGAVAEPAPGPMGAEWLPAALDNMHQGLCMVDPQGCIVVSNRRYAEIIGIPPEAVKPGATINDLLKISHSLGHFPGKTIEQVEKDLWSSLEKGSESQASYHRNGRDFSVKHRITEDGFWVATFEDITAQVAAEAALRDSEARLRATLDAMPDCVKIFDAAGKLIYINPQGLELLQAPDFEALSRPGYIAVPLEYLDSCMATHHRVIEGESMVNYYEVIGLEGRRRHVEAYAVPMRMPDGSRAHLCISRDITERMNSEEAIRRNEERLRLVHEATGLAEFEAGSDGIAVVSDRLLEQFGMPLGNNRLTFENILSIVDPRDRQRLADTITTSLSTNEECQVEFRIIRADNGETRWISSHTKVKRDEEGNAIRSIGAHIDITDRKRADEALRESEQRFRLAAEAAGLGVWDYDSSVESQRWSERFREILGLPADAEPNLSVITQLVHPEDRTAFLKQLLEIRGACGDARFQETYRIRQQGDKTERWITMNGWKSECESGGPSRIIIAVRDITEEKTASERIRWAATHDSLTRLPNRRLFHERLDLAIESAKSSGGTVGLLLLDLDHFKQINDTLGHDVGDLMLKTFAERLKAAVRSCDTVARLGGDEFAIVLPDIEGSVSLEEVAAAIFGRLSRPVVHEGSILDCRTSVGASLFPNHGKSPDELLKYADIALYSTKTNRRGSLTLFHPELLEEVLERTSMVNLGREAVQEDRISPHYQPKIDLVTGEVDGFEALLRWRDSDGTVQPPARIAAAFDEPDVAAAISDRMLERSIKDMRGWLDRGVGFRNVAFNASAAEFRRGGFAEGVLEQLERAGVPPSCLQIEVTETVFLGRGAEYVLTALKMLNSEGVKIALDDFGTGYASLRHLKEFPVEIIKIDQSFVRDMVIDPGDEAIVRAVINLGQSLGMKVVAEGIECAEQADRLRLMGCDLGQGYLFSKAVPAEEVPNLLIPSFDATQWHGRLSDNLRRPRLVASNA